ncbi:MAG: acetoacetate decarboxylase family protein, partial [Oscillospiraceae bacterium]|nr:acetoacetate decarboxylase family protein [Oscillospiraceae bacterium]
ELAVRIGRDGLGEPKKQGETVVFDDGKKYIGTVSRFGQELLHIEADIVGPGPEGLGGGPMDNLHFQYSIKVDGSGLTPVYLLDSHFDNVATDTLLMENCTVKTTDTPFDIYGEIPIEEVVACFAATLEMRGHARYLAEVDPDEFLPYAFFKHDDYRLIVAKD